MALTAGSIAFVEVDMDGNVAQTFKIVVLEDIGSGEAISFTDNGWINGDEFSSIESTLHWVNSTGSSISAGTVITFSTTDAQTDDNWTVSHGSVSETGDLDFFLGTGGLGDQIIALQGGTGLAMYHADSGGAFDTSVTGNSAHKSKIHPDLTEGTNAMALQGNGHHMAYTGPTNSADPSTWLTRLNDPNNWTANSTFSGSSITVTCYCKGTLIATPNGEATVETLKIGDLIRVRDNHVVEVKWIGRQTVATRFWPAERLMPVRFTAGALGDGLPHTDLTVTADHAMLIDGVLVHAGALVNGTTITRVPLSEMGKSYTVYHIETEKHEIILANGAPAETFIDNVSRRVFDNYAEFEALYGEVPEMEELDYPRAMSARQVPPAIKAKLGITKAA
jgi:hypothetical protein